MSITKSRAKINSPSFKTGQIAVVGRPNAGKSTLINALVGQKVNIVSPRPQTTRAPLRAVYWDERGQLIFWDTPGLFQKRTPLLGKKINTSLNQTLESVNLVLYVIDRSRPRGAEENIILGKVRPLTIPKILVFNKIDIKGKNFYHQYSFLGEEFDEEVAVSARRGTHLKTLLEKIFLHLPRSQQPLFNPDNFQAQKSPDLTPEKFIAEIVREKAFLCLRQEIPYSLTVQVKEIREEKNFFTIRAQIITINSRYQKMIIGQGAQKIKEIGILARREIELITNKKVFLELNVQVDPHWPEKF